MNHNIKHNIVNFRKLEQIKAIRIFKFSVELY